MSTAFGTPYGDGLEAGRRVDRLHHCLVAIERAASDGHGEDFVVGGVDEGLVRVAGSAAGRRSKAEEYEDEAHGDSFSEVS